MKTYNEQIYTRQNGEWGYIDAKVNVPTPKELQATSPCNSGQYIVVISNFGDNFSVVLFKNGESECEYGMRRSNLNRKEAVEIAAEWVVEN